MVQDGNNGISGGQIDKEEVGNEREEMTDRNILWGNSDNDDDEKEAIDFYAIEQEEESSR